MKEFARLREIGFRVVSALLNKGYDQTRDRIYRHYFKP
jgi:hypothetical protein